MLKNFRAYQLAIAFYELAQTLELPEHLKDQFSRASSSIVLNLAEGAGRRAKTDQARFYTIAMGSLRKTQSILELVNQVNQSFGVTLIKLARASFD